MGYEIKVIMGQVTSLSEEESGKWFNIIAEYDLCKVDLSKLQDVIKKGAKLLKRQGNLELTKIFYYEGSDTVIKEDCYGEELIAFDPKLLLAELIKQNQKEEYRRFPPLIALLTSMIEEFKDGFQVVLFGH